MPEKGSTDMMTSARNAGRFAFLRKAVAALAMAGLAVAPVAAQKKQLLEYPSIHTPTVGYHGMVVTQSALASQVGADSLRRGGNAGDAAVAVAFALAVTLPRAGNIGGDGFMLIHDAKSGKDTVIDFRSVAPRGAREAMFVDDRGRESPVASRGYLAPSVPGSVAGLYAAQRKYGRLPWADTVQPAIALARDGVKLTPDEAFVFTWGKERLSTSAAARAAYYKPAGSPYAAGETMRLPDLATTLEAIAERGADGFYKGPEAGKIAAAKT